jgi:hypothetical protein
VAREPKTGVVQTPLGPLPEDFFEFEPKAKLRALLAQAHDIWRGAKDDQDGQIKRWYAYQVVLGALREYVEDDVPSEHMYLLIRLLGYFDDLKRGRQPEEMKAALRSEPTGGPGLLSDRAWRCAAACATVEVLSEGQRPLSKGRRPRFIENIVKEAAEAIGEQPRAFGSWRKAFNVGEKGPQARKAYDGILRMLREQPDPKQAARTLLETYKRTLA